MANDLTMTSAAYGSTTPKFTGTQFLNAGRGNITTSVVPYGNDTSGSTHECWVRSGGVTDVRVAYGSTAANFWMGCISNGTAACNNGTASNKTSSTQICDGAWHHLAMTTTAAGATKLYVDGTERISFSATTPPPSLSTAGVRAFTSSFTWLGDVCEVAVWDGVKYTGNFTPPSSPYVGDEADLFALWHLDGDGVDSKTDSSASRISVISATPLLHGGSTTFSGTFANGEPSGIDYAFDGGASDSAVSPTITVTSGSGATAAGTWSFDVDTPIRGDHSIIVYGTGTYASTSDAYDFTVVPSLLPNDAAIVYSPYTWDITEDRSITINAGAYFSVMFTGSACKLLFDVSSVVAPASQIWYRFDGYGPWTKADVAAEIDCSLPVETDGSNAYTYHLLEAVVKSTTETHNRWNVAIASTAVKFTGIMLDVGASVKAPTYSNKNIIVFGDSITEGVRTVSSIATDDTDRNDAVQGWAYRMRALLGCEIGVVGFGGAGLLRTGSGGVPKLATSYAYLYSGVARSFSPRPDLVVINIGTNDSGQTDGAVTAEFTTVLNALLSVIQNVTICVLRPFNGSKSSALQSGIVACDNPEQVHYIDTTGFFVNANGTSDNLHPGGANDYGLIAASVANAIRPYLTAVRSWVH